MLKRFLSYYGPHKRLFILDMATAAFRAGCAVVIPLLTRNMLNDLSTSRLSGIIWQISALAALVLAMSAASYINLRWGHILGTRMETDMRSDLFRHLQKLSFGYFDRTKTGHIMSRISNDLFTIAEVAHHGPEDLFISLCMVTGAFVIMYIFNPMLATIALIPLPIMLGWGMLNRRRMKEGFRQVRTRIADINSSVENSIQGIRLVKAFANEDVEYDKFSEVNSQFRYAKEGMYGVMARFHSGMLLLTEGYVLVVIGGGTILIWQGTLTMPDLIAFLLYGRFLLNPIQRMVNFVEQFQQGAASFERFVEIMDVDPEIVDAPKARRLTAVAGRIDVRDLWFRYPSSPDWVLQEVNLAIEPGQTVALVGASGAGKSTLAALIPRFYEPQRGGVFIDGCDIRDVKRRSLRANIGIVQQNVFLFDTSIRENIMFGRPEATEEELIAAAENANIHSFIQSLPAGFDTVVGEHGVMLSGGQRQRVSIARVFLKDPPILIFDEATSSLDTESESMIRDAMNTLSAGRTTLIIAHRLATVKHADFTIVMADGKIVEQGNHHELLTQEGYYHNLHSHSFV